MVQARDVSGGIHFHSGGRPESLKPRQLPGDVRGFVNRGQELGRLDAILTDGGDESVSVPVCVLAGTAGVGKTSLALRWAHRVQDRFPDGQLYVNLRGYDPGAPVTPQEALHRFLSALGVPAAAIPADLEAGAALYRSLLAGRRVLVILDNAATASQVRPLLPGAAGCLVTVTSRSRLSGLAVRDGAHTLTLGTLDEAEAVALLSVVTAPYRPQDDPGRLIELARLCARLPLALRIAAERAASRPRMGLDDLIRDLRDESALWDALSVGDDEEAEAVRTVFAWSYRALPAEAARLFRLLGLHPGAEFGTAAAAALDGGGGTGRIRHLLDVLVGAHLLEQTGPERYEFHDLLRAYAADQARHEESPEGRGAALRRVLVWYLHSADAAQSWINPQEAHIPLDPPGDGLTPASFADYDEAMRWYETERGNLLAATRVAEEAGLDVIAWQLPAVLRSVHMLLNPFEEWLAMGRIGLRAARRLGDRTAEAELLESLGMACTQSHRLAEGAEYHQGALAARRETGDRLGEALSLNDIGLIHLRGRRLEAAKDHFEQAAAVFRELDAARWEAVVTANLAEVAYELARPEEASGFVLRALEMHRELGNQGGEGNALRILSAIQRDRGRPEEALASAEGALEIARTHRNHMWEGYWLLELGRAQLANGVFDAALVSFQRAASLQRRLGDRAREARAWDGAGETYRRLGRSGEAADFHRRAAAAHRELDDLWHMALSLDGLAGALREVDEADGADGAEEARRHWAEALRALASYDDPRAVALRERVSATFAQ
ncbi:ATP-binding protein [Streptomyces rhizosphaericus]|uniref:Tetratricopeptide repeat protein n=1 Tax=Streptomyces rhizosphaericus TaxID=114699 RepID=A0A6G4AR65_9ACTN|nr:tetratricopeptide repeat protein [Streptomyces rhizosphaericus]NEW75845.1 tetratricopeptide repeat protein [Streptomyces rhizosphaericus]